MTTQNNRSRRVARKIADTIQRTKSLEARLKLVQTDPDLNDEERETATQALRNIYGQTVGVLNALKARASELPALPVVPTNMSTNIQQSIFSTDCLDFLGHWGHYRKLGRTPTVAARAYRTVQSAYAAH